MNERYDIVRGLKDHNKYIEESEKAFNKPLFNVENKNKDSVSIKGVDKELLTFSSHFITKEILQVYENIRNYRKNSDSFYSTNSDTALILSNLDNQQLKRSGYCAPSELYDCIRMVAKNCACIYFVECSVTKLVKIGVSNNINLRLSSLQTGSPTPLTLLGAVVFDKSLEGKLHKHFSKHNSHGEWFHPNKNLSKIIENLNSKDALFIVFKELEIEYRNLSERQVKNAA